MNNCHQLQYAHFRDMILSFGKEGEEPVNFNYQRIQPMANSKIVTRQMLKRYLPVVKKGLINLELLVLPFGYQ
jgi:hypothetical protein